MNKFDIIALPKDNNLNQGLIFTGAIAEDYSHCQVYGLIITARCDITHGKVKIFNYLPIVGLNNWIEVDLRNIILPLISKNILNEMKNILNALKLSVAILDTVHPKIVYDKILIDVDNVKLRDKFHNFLIQLNSIEELNVCFNKNKMINQINLNHKIRDDVINKLVKQNLSGYYFIPDIGIDSTNSGYVVLLREINGIPKNLALRMANGLTKAEYDYFVDKNSYCINKLAFSHAEYSMPISQMQSPYIEHLMQCFGNTFCRIGIKDIEEKYIETLNCHFDVTDKELL